MSKDFRLSTILMSAVMLLTGLVFLLKPRLSIRIICYAIAAVFLVFAVTRLIVYLKEKSDNRAKALGSLLIAIASLVVSLIFVLRPHAITQIIPIVLGFIVMVDGIVLIIAGLLYRAFLPRHGLYSFLIGLLCLLLGFLAITHSFDTQILFMQFIGASLAVSAVASLINRIMIEYAERRKEKALSVDFAEEERKATDKTNES